MKAIWNQTVIAESDDIVEVEGNAYFPMDALKPQFFKPSGKHTVCGWKGIASYYSIEVDGVLNEDAAWYYPEPKEQARQILNRVAFWKGVTIQT